GGSRCMSPGCCRARPRRRRSPLRSRGPPPPPRGRAAARWLRRRGWRGGTGRRSTRPERRRSGPYSRRAGWRWAPSDSRRRRGGAGGATAGGAGRDPQVTPASLVRARATQDPAAHVESMPMTNPAVAETKVTDPGSKPLGTGDPAGHGGLGAVVVDGATAVVVVLVDLRVLVLVVVVRRGALVGDELHDAAQTARTSTATTVGRRR